MSVSHNISISSSTVHIMSPAFNTTWSQKSWLNIAYSYETPILYLPASITSKSSVSGAVNISKVNHEPFYINKISWSKFWHSWSCGKLAISEIILSPTLSVWECCGAAMWWHQTVPTCLQNPGPARSCWWSALELCCAQLTWALIADPSVLSFLLSSNQAYPHLNNFLTLFILTIDYPPLFCLNKH